jgi:glycosyltransferase involved in cell wall biosynthesis
MVRIFIGIPTLNRPELVVETIESVRRQNFRDYRVIVSDNGSSAATVARVEAYVQGLGDARFTFHRQPENVGEYGQGRFFFAEAQDHEYFMILHDDDLAMPDYLARAIAALDANPGAAFFVANYYAMDRSGTLDPERTLWARHEHGRDAAAEGLIDVLDSHMRCGFTPISGTVFRRTALDASGFVDPDCFGNYPFETNIFLRLGEIGAKAWFCPEELLGIRFHPGSLRQLHLLHDPELVGSCLKIWTRRRFDGYPERRRKEVVSRLYRADALIKLRQRNMSAARLSLGRALRENPRSPRNWAMAPLILLAPGVLRAAIRPLPVYGDRPKYGPPGAASGNSGDSGTS